MKTILLSNYWPNLNYFFYVLNSNEIIIEQHDHYQKQTFRNRTQILSANGVLNLIVPVKKFSNHTATHLIEIDYKENWQTKHWRAIESAYRNSPYFEFFETEVKYFYEIKFEHLIEFNTEQINCVLKILRLKRTISYSEKYVAHYLDENDHRFEMNSIINLSSYHQVFKEKFGFTPNLSILDLLFNSGLDTTKYLLEKK